MELRHLRYFVAVAEELHFGRAAARLHIAQPPLSQQIRQLEAELGVVLLHRTTHYVTLTAAGRAFLDEAQRILAQVEGATRTAQRVGHGEVGRLRLGFIDSAVYGALPAVIRAYRAQFPHTRLVLRQVASPLQREALVNDRLDVGFLRPPAPEAELAHITLQRESFVAAVPIGHALARRRSLTLAELAEEPFILFTPTIRTDFVIQARRLCQQAGFEPVVAQEVAEMQTLVGLVAAGLGISLVPASTRTLFSRHVRYLPLADVTEQAELTLAWRREGLSEVAREFVRVAQGLALADPGALAASPPTRPG